MKTCDEMMNSLFRRRAQYVTAQRKKKRVMASAAATLCAVSLLGGSVWYLNRPQHDIPVTPATDDGAVTTTTIDIPTENEDTTTTTMESTTIPTASTTIDSGVVAPTTTVTTVTPTRTTTKPTTGKTEPPKSSGTKQSITGYIPPIPTTTQPTEEKLLITGSEPDNDIFDVGTLSNTEKYISNALQEKMRRYKGVDATYAVIVAIPIMNEDTHEDFWASTEELAQFHREFYAVYFAFEEEAKRLNPSWDILNASEIEVWTDTMRTNYEYYLTLIDKWNDLRAQYLAPYLASVLNQRFEALKALCEKEPVDIFCQTNLILNITHHAYYAELTPEAINILAEQGGYTFCLALKDQTDYGHWDNTIR